MSGVAWFSKIRRRIGNVLLGRVLGRVVLGRVVLRYMSGLLLRYMSGPIYGKGAGLVGSSPPPHPCSNSPTR
jgi:hypothetical protein